MKEHGRRVLAEAHRQAQTAMQFFSVWWRQPAKGPGPSGDVCGRLHGGCLAGGRRFSNVTRDLLQVVGHVAVDG